MYCTVHSDVNVLRIVHKCNILLYINQDFWRGESNYTFAQRGKRGHDAMGGNALLYCKKRVVDSGERRVTGRMGLDEDGAVPKGKAVTFFRVDVPRIHTVKY